jgi:hypothetical protein
MNFTTTVLGTHAAMAQSRVEEGPFQGRALFPRAELAHDLPEILHIEKNP